MSEWKPIAEIAADVRARKITATELVEKALKLIDEKKEYRAIIATCEKRARERAKEIDKSPKGRLAGVPFIAKDNFLTFGSETTAASNILKGFEAPYQATAIEKLEAEGAICVAKANLDAFAHGSSTENSDFFTTLNPHDKTRVPGGSSGGSAASIALELAPFALGTDTGGSIRQPAAFSGIIGYKPTYGLVSRSGVIAMASSTDVIGPLAKTVEDAAYVLDVLAAQDPLDSTTIEPDKRGYALKSNKGKLDGKKVGVVKEHIGEGLDPLVKKSTLTAISKLKEAGAKVEEVSLASLSLALPCYYIICPAEVSSNLARYDGQKYGFSEKSATNLEDSYLKSRSRGFGREAKRRIMIGSYVLSSGYYDAYYKRALLVRTKLIQEFQKAFAKFDFLIGPTAPTVAFKIGEKAKDPLSMYLSDVMTVAPNLTGMPAISIPINSSGNLPVGLQIMADKQADRNLLEFAASCEGVLS